MTRPGPYLRVVKPDGTFDPFGKRSTDDLIREAGVLREELGQIVAARISGELSTGKTEPRAVLDLKQAIRELDAEIAARR